MARWITIDSLTRTDTGGMALAVDIADTAQLHLEASPSHRDIRVVSNSTVVQARLTRDWTIKDVLGDDVVVWTNEGHRTDGENGEE